MFFGPSGARILPIEMILNVSDNRMCFDRERRIVLTEANFVTCVDRDCAFHGYCPMDEHIVPQRDCHRAASLSYDECGKGLHDEVPARGASSKFRDPNGVRRKGGEEMGGGTCRIRYPRIFYGGYRGVSILFERERRRAGAGGHIQ
jgi:hypothetical protein